MTVFQRASRVLHANPALSAVASYIPHPDRGLPQAEVRVILSEPLDAMGMPVSGATVRGREASITSDALAYEPRRGDRLWLGETGYGIERAEQDVERTSWRLTLRGSG